MVDFFYHRFDRPPVGRMIITKNRCCRLSRKDNLKDLPHILFDCFGIGTPELKLQLNAPLLLVLGHSPLPAQLTVSEVNEEVSPLFNGNVVVDRVVLAELKRFEPINDNFMNVWAVLHHPVVKEKAMAAQAGDVPIDGLGRNHQIACDLSVGHPSGGFHDDLGVQFGELLPVGSGECLGAEASIAGFASKPLDTVRSG